jgi:ABC-type antimicrobial peptide transport system permease subunit
MIEFIKLYQVYWHLFAWSIDMWLTLLAEPYVELALRFFINFAAMLLLMLGIYYRRYGDKELVTAAALFNIFIFSVLTVLSGVNFSVSAGFGLFAILALFTLRSEQITKIEITYFFGSVSIAVICSIKGTTLPFVMITNTAVLISVFLLDHPFVLPSVNTLRITLDKIDEHALSNPELMCNDLSTRLGVSVLSYQIKSLDFINDLAVLNVNYRKV